MKYKVWGKAKAAIKPHKHHFMTAGVVLFIVGFLLVFVTVFRLAMLYADSFYSGEREPYIQSLSSHSAVIRWHSKNTSTSRVEVSSELGKTGISVKNKSIRADHEIFIDGLSANTKYYYRVFNDDQLFRGGAEYWFETAPEAGSDSAVRLWLIGAPNKSMPDNHPIRDSMKNWLKHHAGSNNSNPDLIISTGNNAYENGANEDYQAGLFNVYAEFFKNISFWPVYGEIDAKGWSFFSIFSLPKEAESGGVASGTEQYYSIDYASVHMIFLDSNEGAYSANDKMIRWLKQDLQTTKQKWVLVFFHHPPYTKGSHNSDDFKDSGSRMFNMRKRILPVLEQAGVDLVVSGHSHSYERSYLIKCHYGVASSFQRTSIIEEGPRFTKPLSKAPLQGTIYTVMGASSSAEVGALNHPVMAFSKAELGSMIIDIEGDRLSSRFINTQAKVLDQFEIYKTDNNSSNNKAPISCQ